VGVIALKHSPFFDAPVSPSFNVYFTVRMYIGIGTTPAGCRLWFAYQAVVVQILLASVEGALMHRGEYF
jgi:hypothetical protein